MTQQVISLDIFHQLQLDLVKTTDCLFNRAYLEIRYLDSTGTVIQIGKHGIPGCLRITQMKMDATSVGGGKHAPFYVSYFSKWCPEDDVGACAPNATVDEFAWVATLDMLRELLKAVYQHRLDPRYTCMLLERVNNLNDTWLEKINRL